MLAADLKHEGVKTEGAVDSSSMVPESKSRQSTCTKGGPERKSPWESTVWSSEKKNLQVSLETSKVLEM